MGYFCVDFQDYELLVCRLKTSGYWLVYPTTRHKAVLH